MGYFGSDLEMGRSFTSTGREGRTEGRRACEPNDQSTWVMFGLLGAQITVGFRSAGPPLRREGTVSRPLKRVLRPESPCPGSAFATLRLVNWKRLCSNAQIGRRARGECLSGPGVVGLGSSFVSELVGSPPCTNAHRRSGCPGHQTVEVCVQAHELEVTEAGWLEARRGACLPGRPLTKRTFRFRCLECRPGLKGLCCGLSHCPRSSPCQCRGRVERADGLRADWVSTSGVCLAHIRYLSVRCRSGVTGGASLP